MQTDAETLYQRLRCSPTLAVMEQGIRWVLAGSCGAIRGSLALIVGMPFSTLRS